MLKNNGHLPWHIDCYSGVATLWVCVVISPYQFYKLLLRFSENITCVMLDFGIFENITCVRIPPEWDFGINTQAAWPISRTKDNICISFILIETCCGMITSTCCTFVLFVFLFLLIHIYLTSYCTTVEGGGQKLKYPLIILSTWYPKMVALHVDQNNSYQ